MTEEEDVPKKIGGEARGACNFCLLDGGLTGLPKAQELGMLAFLAAWPDPAGELSKYDRQVRGEGGVSMM